MKELVMKMVDKLEVERQYGNLSCFDFPEEYQKMVDLEVEICEALDKYNENEYSKRASDLYSNILDIAIDVRNGNINADTLEINYCSIDEWTEVYITSGMCEEGKKIFESLFYSMPTDVKNAWLENNHLCNHTNVYTNIMIEYILTAHE